MKLTLKVVNTLKKSLPEEVGFAEISIECEYERTNMKLSIEKKIIYNNNFNPNKFVLLRQMSQNMHLQADNASNEWKHRYQSFLDFLVNTKNNPVYGQIIFVAKYDWHGNF